MGIGEQAATGLKTQNTFAELVIGVNNHIAAKACLQATKSPGETYNPLYLYGPPGTGKTHLMQAVAHSLLAATPTAKVRYISSERFMHEIISSISDDSLFAVRNRYSELDLWLIDDVQFLMESKSAQAEFFHVFNNLHQENRQIILAGDRPPNLLTELDKTIRSRLGWGLSAAISTPDLKTRIEILHLKQSRYGLALTEEMMQYAAVRLKSNVRELEGFLKKINAYVTLSHQALGMDLVVHVANEILPENQGEAVPAAEVVAQAKFEVSQIPDVESAQIDELNEELRQVGSGGARGSAGAVRTSTSTPAPAETARGGGRPLEVVMPHEPAASAADPATSAAPAPAAEPPARESEPPKKEPVQPAPSQEKSAPPEPAPPKEAKPPDPPVADKAAEKTPPSQTPARRQFVPPADSIVAPAPPAAEPPPVEAPAAATPPVLDLPDEPEEDEEMPNGHKEIGAVFFYPEGGEESLKTVSKKFQEVIKKHKLKFRLKRAACHAYQCTGKVDYAKFVDVCKESRVPVAIVVGPPPNAFVAEQDFYDLLSVTLDVQGISLQLVNWSEINKDYRYLNLALDIALVRTR